MSAQNYALLSPDQTSVIFAPVTLDSALYSAWVTANNPKATRYRVINMIAQPTFDPSSQVVIQTGWTVTPSDVEPVWSVQSLSAAQINYNTVMAGNVVALCTNAITNWSSFNAAQKDTALLTVIKVIKALLQYQFGVNN